MTKSRTMKTNEKPTIKTEEIKKEDKRFIITKSFIEEQIKSGVNILKPNTVSLIGSLYEEDFWDKVNKLPWPLLLKGPGNENQGVAWSQVEKDTQPEFGFICENIDILINSIFEEMLHVSVFHKSVGQGLNQGASLSNVEYIVQYLNRLYCILLVLKTIVENQETQKQKAE